MVIVLIIIHLVLAIVTWAITYLAIKICNGEFTPFDAFMTSLLSFVPIANVGLLLYSFITLTCYMHINRD